MEKLIYIIKDTEDQDTGANCNFHILNEYEVDIENSNIDLLFSSYVNKKMFEQGRSALSQYYRIKLNGLNFDAEKPLEQALKEIVSQPPEGHEAEESTQYRRDKYFFSGGKVNIETLKEDNKNAG